MDFNGKKALVTGGSRGIGKAISKRLAELGAAVAVNYTQNADAAEDVVAQIRADGGVATVAQADVADYEQASELVNGVFNEFGQLDILINNAGITRDGLVLRLSQEDWADVINTNLTGAFNCTQAAGKKMIKKRIGAIVNVSSIVGLTGNAGQANYAASKAGLIGLTKSSALELATRNIRINAVAPGFIETEMTDLLNQELKSEIKKRIPLGRFGTPMDVAEAVVWLASDKAAYMTGQVLIIDGGMAM